MLLALDTASETCGVALVHDGSVIERAEAVGQRHSERLLPMIEALLAEAGVSLRQLDAVAFGAGPGSFTGLRISCGVAQGIAYAIDRPVVPVGNLQALAFNAARRVPAAQRVAAAIDARMGECYWAVYAADSSSAELLPPALSRAEDLADALRGAAPDLLAGEAFSVFSSHLDGLPATYRRPEATATAAAIAQLGVAALQAGRAVDPALAAPHYVRNRVAQTTEERQALRAARAA
jgi:tRNA threonylcarbamoyladenosine biosynthesis protein TsaB